jgi:hypothetical protein
MNSKWYEVGARLAEARRNSTIPERIEKARDRKAREAEDRLFADIDSRIERTGWRIHQSVRVPDPVSGWKRELDFVLTSPNCAYLLELKSWAGEAQLTEDGTLLQTWEGTPKAESKKFFEGLADRAMVLQHYKAEHGRPIAPVRPFLIFDDRDITLSKALLERDDVLTRRRLLKHLPREVDEPSWLWRLLMAIIRFFDESAGRSVDQEPPLPTDAIRLLRQSLDRLPTWDEVYRRGGDVLQGDLRIPAPLAARFEALDRARAVQSSFSFDSSYLRAIFADPSPRAGVRLLAKDYSVRPSHVDVDTVLPFHWKGGSAREKLIQVPLRESRSTPTGSAFTSISGWVQPGGKRRCSCHDR